MGRVSTVERIAVIGAPWTSAATGIRGTTTFVGIVAAKLVDPWLIDTVTTIAATNPRAIDWMGPASEMCGALAPRSAAASSMMTE